MLQLQIYTIAIVPFYNFSRLYNSYGSWHKKRFIGAIMFSRSSSK